MCPLTPAVSNYPWGMASRLGLQPPAIIWVMAKLHKSFVENWKKEEIIQEGVGEGMEQEARKGKRGEDKKRKYEEEHDPGVLLLALKLLSPHFSLCIDLPFLNIYSSLVQNAVYFTVWFFSQIRIQHETNRVMRDEIRMPRSFHLDTSILLSWIITALQSRVFGFVTDFDSPFCYSVSYRKQSQLCCFFLLLSLLCAHRANYAD